jgi:hypothetical protein
MSSTGAVSVVEGGLHRYDALLLEILPHTPETSRCPRAVPDQLPEGAVGQDAGEDGRNPRPTREMVGHPPRRNPVRGH